MYPGSYPRHFDILLKGKVKFHVPSLGEGKDPPYCKVAWKYLAPTLSGERKNLWTNFRGVVRISGRGVLNSWRNFCPAPPTFA